MIYPATMAYAADLSKTIDVSQQVGVTFDVGPLKSIAETLDAMMIGVGELETALLVEEFADTEAHMLHCANTMLPLMAKVRAHADELEHVVADQYWPLPKYREMLFIK